MKCPAVIHVGDSLFGCDRAEGHEGSHSHIEPHENRYRVYWDEDEREKCDLCGKLVSAVLHCVSCDKAFCSECQSKTPPKAKCCRCEKKKHKKARK